MIRGFLSPISFNKKESKFVWLLLKDLATFFPLYIFWTSLGLWCTKTILFGLTNGLLREIDKVSQIFTILFLFVISFSYLYSLYYQFIKSRPTNSKYVPSKYISLSKSVDCKGFYVPEGVYYEIFTDLMDLIVEAVSKDSKFIFDEKGSKVKVIEFQHKGKTVIIKFYFNSYSNYYWLKGIMPNIYEIISKTRNRYYSYPLSIYYVTELFSKDDWNIKCEKFNTRISHAFDIDFNVWYFENSKFKKSNKIKDWKSI